MTGAVSVAFERLVEVHRAMGSPLPDYLNPPVSADRLADVAAEFDHRLPEDLTELYSLANGVALDRWNAAYRGMPAYLLPGWDFPSLAYGVEESRELSRIAGSLPDGEVLWRDEWLMVFSKLTTGDEHIVAATDREWSELWTVRWEFEIPQQLELTVAGLLDAAAGVFEALEARWDRSLRLIVSDHEREDQFESFPLI